MRGICFEVCGVVLLCGVQRWLSDHSNCVVYRGGCQIIPIARRVIYASQITAKPSYGGRKFEHVLKHGLRNDLYVVTLGWFVDSVRKNVRLSESLYRVKSAEENGLNTKSNCLVRVNDTENPCLPVGLREDNKRSNSTQQAQLQLSGKESGTRADLALSIKSIYVDSEISDDVRRKENMTADEVVAAIHTDWKHADQLRSAYVSKESLESGNVQFRRISFLGTRRSFEMLKRVGGDNNSNVYELLIRA